MSHDILICRIDEPIYAKVYEVSGRPLNGHEVKIYAECEKNIDSTGQNDYYFLSLFFSVDDYGMRDYIIGVPFGKSDMSQKEIDNEVTKWITKTALDELPIDINMYLKKEELFEACQNEHYHQ